MALGLAAGYYLQPKKLFAQSANRGPLVVVGWDGAGLNNVAPMMAAGRLPNLSTVAAAGQLIPIKPLCTTLTAPTWTICFTGLTPDVTGVMGNRRYQDQVLTSPRSALVWLRHTRYSSEVINSTLQENGIKVGWFVSKMFLADYPAVSPLYYAATMADGFAMEHPNYNPQYLEDLLLKAEEFILAQIGNYMCFLHLNPDKWGHTYGENSPEYLAEFERCDRALGRLLELQQAQGFKIMVLTDHGFNEGTHHHVSAPDLWLATDIPLAAEWRNGGEATIRDVPMTILDYFGLPKHHRQAYGQSLLKSSLL